MKSYRAKDRMINAIQWDGKQESFKELKQHFPEAKPAYLNSVFLHHGPKLYVANVGDVILLSKPPRILNLDEFNAEFEPYPEKQGEL